MIDNFYTPNGLATDLVAYSGIKNPKTIADFAVGAGSLLSAAHNIWPSAELFGIDVDIKAIRETKKSHPNTRTFKVDFLSTAASRSTSSLVGKIDLVVLNPPFSCKGGSFEETIFDSEQVKSSKAMAFILKSCSYLSVPGEILAIIPRSCLFSQKDRKAREALQKSYDLIDLGEYRSPGFNGASVSVHLVRIAKKSPQKNQKATTAVLDKVLPKREYGVVIMRGSHPVSMGEFKSNAPSLIHTTDLFNGEVAISRLRATKLQNQVSGPVLMIPRVARPSIGKVTVANFVRPVVPSDCIICMKTVPTGSEQHLQKLLIRFWPSLSDAYSGTCASYLTLDALEKLMCSLGFSVEIKKGAKIWNPSEQGNSAMSRSKLTK